MTATDQQQLTESISIAVGRTSYLADLLRRSNDHRCHGEIRGALSNLLRLAEKLDVVPRPQDFGGFGEVIDGRPVVTATIIGRIGSMIRAQHQCPYCNAPEEFQIPDAPDVGPVFVQTDCINDRSPYIETGLWLRVPQSEWVRFANWEKSSTDKVKL